MVLGPMLTMGLIVLYSSYFDNNTVEPLVLDLHTQEVLVSELLWMISLQCYMYCYAIDRYMGMSQGFFPRLSIIPYRLV